MRLTSRANQPIKVSARRRLRIAISGAVQGVGFRPFVFRLASELVLGGWIANAPGGVLIEVEGEERRVAEFLTRLDAEKPPRCVIQKLEHQTVEPLGDEKFQIRPSIDGEKNAWILPDIATCAACLTELFDPADRRYRYPFINCTQCGPRYSIIEELPYDRARTTMKNFAMCARCQAEYDDPMDRRFHAQPNACPVCGPRLQLSDAAGGVLAGGHRALADAVAMIHRGGIVAVKGIGGFHLLTNAADSGAVKRLRARKRREAKPLALMFPSLASVLRVCELSQFEKLLLTAAAAPIVLLRRRPDGLGRLSSEVAPDNPYLGAMLPYTPLHHLLMGAIGAPVVATSGNLSEEPICIDEQEALQRLGAIADLFLLHNRPIARQLDDSVLAVMAGREMVLRRGRGYAPLQFSIATPMPALLAVGGHLKNSVAASKGSGIFLSQHIGDLESAQARDAFERELQSLDHLLQRQVQAMVCDRHPDYASTRYAHRAGKKIVAVQHHHAHVFSCMVENNLEGALLGVAWDGSGLGDDGTLWGGEFFLVDELCMKRVAHLRPFMLPGGEQAIREPRRAAAGLLYARSGAPALDENWRMGEAFSSAELDVIKTMMARNLNAPLTSSVGRLFDAVAFLLGLGAVNSFEGQAAMALEFALDGIDCDEFYPIQLVDPGAGQPLQLDWREMIGAIVEARAGGIAAAVIAAKFHNSLVEAIVSLAARFKQERVALSGGCFQNRYLTERAVARLRAVGLKPYWHRRIPPNDGGIAVGQLAAAARAMAME